METFGKTVNLLKDGYLALIDWVDEHPHRTVWCFVGAVLVVVVLWLAFR